MRRRRSKLGGRSVQRLEKLLKDGKLESLTEGEMAKVVGNDPCTAERFAPYIDFHKVGGRMVGSMVKASAKCADHFTHSQLECVSPDVWVDILKGDPSLLEKMPKNSANYAALLSSGLDSLCETEKFSGELWKLILLKNPACIKYCNASRLSEADWSALYPVREQIIKTLK